MKLFVTVGAQMPFDRLIRAVDAWATEHSEHSVLAQVGDTEYTPKTLRASRFITPSAFGAQCDEADVIIGHAGTGTLFAALTRGKPVLVMPRRAHLAETRNDHQVATARHFRRRAGVHVADDERDFSQTLDRLLAGLGRPDEDAPRLGTLPANAPLLRTIARFIDS